MRQSCFFLSPTLCFIKYFFIFLAVSPVSNVCLQSGLVGVWGPDVSEQDQTFAHCLLPPWTHLPRLHQGNSPTWGKTHTHTVLLAFSVTTYWIYTFCPGDGAMELNLSSLLCASLLISITLQHLYVLKGSIFSCLTAFVLCLWCYVRTNTCVWVCVSVVHSELYGSLAIKSICPFQWPYKHCVSLTTGFKSNKHSLSIWARCSICFSCHLSC